MSPQLEPPSRYLDLTDADLGCDESSTFSKPQPVMVCDASYLAHTSDDTEVEVVVNYEDSPARVICHTPIRLERSFRSDAASVSSKQSVKVEVPKTVGLTPARLFNDNHTALSKGGEDAEPLISQHSRGIIKEILAEEIGSENVDSISLYSHNSSSPRHPGLSSPKHTSGKLSAKYPLNSSPIDNEDKPSNLTYLRNDDSEKPASSVQSPPRQPKSDIELTKLLRNSTDRARYKKATTFRINSDGSDSETLSLYEYVIPKQPMSDLKNAKTDNDGTNALSQESSTSSPSISKSSKKSKQKRVVPSRYKQAAAASKQSSTSTSISVSKDSSSESSVSRSFPKPKAQAKLMATTKNRSQNKKPTTVRQMPSKNSASQTSSVSLSDHNFRKVESPQTAVRDLATSEKELQKDRKTSTPTHDLSGFPNYMDASSIQSVSALSVDASINFSKLGEHYDLKSDEGDVTLASAKADVHQDIPDKYLPLKLDLEYSRYLQACFLNSKAKKAYREQDKKAMKDLNSLWNLVEKKREEVLKAEKDLSRLKQFHHVDQFFDKTNPELTTLTPKLPQVEADYLKLCQALDTTRHQIPTKDIHLPVEDEDVREAYENKMELILRESEVLLNEINKAIAAKVPHLTQYRTCLDAVKHNVNAIGGQLREGQTDLEKAQGLCIRLASLTALEI